MRNPGENAGGRVPGRRRGPSGRAASPRQGQAPGSAVPGSGPGSIGPGEPGPGGQVTRQPSIFTPGYSGGRSPRRDPRSGGTGADSGQYADGHYGGPPYEAGQYGSGPYVAGQYGSAGGAAGKGPIRGFPPAPGQPPPLYPPGPFSAWNRAPWPGDNGYSDPGAVGPDTGAWLAQDGEAPGSAGPGEPDAGPISPGPGYADDGYLRAGYADPDYSALAVSDPAADVTSTQAWGLVDDAGTGWSDPNSRSEPGRHAGRTPPEADYDVDPAVPWQAAPGDEPCGWAAPGFAPPGQAGPDPFSQAAPGAFGQAAPGSPGLTARGDFGSSVPGEFARAGPGEPAPSWDGPRRAHSDDGGDGLANRQARRASGGAGAGTRLTQEPPRRPGTRGHGSRGRARPRGRGGPGRVLLAVGLAAAVIAGSAGYLWFSGRHHGAPAAAQHQPTPRSDPTPSTSPSVGVSDHIKSRASDPVPLTLAELFPAKFSDAGITYARTVQKARTHCAQALIGSALTSAVSHAGCTQLMRASYLSSNKLMGTIGVLNLSTLAAAKKAGKAAGTTDFIAQLPAARGPTKRLTKGTGVEAAEVKGHYLVLVWAEFANLRAPKSLAQRRELEAFISALIQKTANVSLAVRMVTGRPAI